LVVRGQVTNSGTLDGREAGSSFVFLGDHFTNNGTVNVGEFHFQKTDLVSHQRYRWGAVGGRPAPAVRPGRS
jgi:hypothetical protein